MFPVVNGDFKERPPLELLKVCEQNRFSGIVEIASPGLGGALHLRGGEIEEIKLTGSAGDPLDAFLALQEGRFTLRQQMPTLDGKLSVESILRGSLTAHAPADLMRFCESAGLSGELKLTRGPRHVDIFYEAGQITSIAVDGKSDADLEDAWGWTTGDFRILARPLFEAPPKSPEESGLHFLKVMQVALSQVMDKAERKREKTDTQQRPIPLVTRKRPTAPTRDDQRVQVYFLEEVVPEHVPAPPVASTTRHSSRDLTAELLDPLGGGAPPTANPVARDETPTQLTDAATRPRAVVAAREPAPVWVWVLLGASIGGAVVAGLAYLTR